MTAPLPWPAQSVAEWLPVWKGAGFFLATFVLEDAAAVGAGLLLAGGALTWPEAFAACFLGIWAGDTGLYALARIGGRRWFERSSLRRYSAKVRRSERWFAGRGTAILIFSRLLPGARLPTYLAAGFLRVPLARFLCVTGAAACVWTAAVLWLTQLLGARLAQGLAAYRHGVLTVAGVGLGLLLARLWARPVAGQPYGRRLAGTLGRWRRWEFWPAWMFYPPVAIYCLWLALKYRGLTLPTAANPGIFSGGLIGESKSAVLRELMETSPEFTAEAERIAGSTLAERLASFRAICRRRQIPYPLVMKPDVGQRGAGFKLIRTELQAVDYLRRTDAPLLAQRYAEGPGEAGIFYYRLPGRPKGRIFAITEKIFPTVTGDGCSTVAELVRRDPRARFMAGKYLERLGRRAPEIPSAGETVRLVEAGNHAQGCIFLDGARLGGPGLVERIDAISKKLSGFYIGRYDVRYANAADLRAGRNFRIIELNGAGAEATSIYDPRNSLFAAYCTLFRQWDLVFAIGAANRRRGNVPMQLSLVWRKWREYGRWARTYPPAD